MYYSLKFHLCFCDYLKKNNLLCIKKHCFQKQDSTFGRLFKYTNSKLRQKKNRFILSKLR